MRFADRRFLVAALLAMLLLLPSSLAIARQEAAAPLAEVLPGQRASVESIAETLSAYRIEAAVDEAAGTVAGTATVTWRNPADVALSEVWFRLFPNAGYYGEGGLAVGEATVDGQPATTGLALEDTALRVDLPEPVAPGGTATLVLPFVATVPADSRGSYGIFQRDSGSGTWIMAGWHPTLAVYDPGPDGGWNLAPPTSAGDPTYAASSLFDVSLRAPAGWRVVSSGAAVAAEDADGSTVHRIVAGPAREFTLVLDADFAVAEAVAEAMPGAPSEGGAAIPASPAVATPIAGETTLVRAWGEPGTDPAALERAAESAASALEAFGERFGPYPFAELDLVETDLDGALAVSWAGVVFLDADAMLAGSAANDPVAFDTVVAHEVAHLWWGALVGTDSNSHPWVNEGLATVSSLGYWLWEDDADAAEASLDRWVLGPARSLLARGDAVVDLPIGGDADPSIRSWATYGKAALGFLAIRAEIGDEAFWSALAAVDDDWRFGIAQPADFLAAFEAESGADLSPLWDGWFAAADMTAEEIEAVAVSYLAETRP